MKSVILVMVAVLMCTVIAMPVESVAQESDRKGIDCSGVPFWAINTALGNEKIKYGASLIPEGAHGQYLKFSPQAELKIIKTGGKFKYDGLISGDLIYIDTKDRGLVTDSKPGVVDHVVLYLGDGKVCHAVAGDKKVVIEKIDYALNRKVDGKTYYDWCVGCGRVTHITSDQRKEVVKLAESIEGAPYQFGAKGYDTQKMRFVSGNEIKESYNWEWSKTPAAVKKRAEGLGDSKDLGGIDFSSIQLNYISMFSDQNGESFSYILKAKKAEKGNEIINIEDATELSLNSFFTGLTLPESEFWVNLNPWEPDVIMDEDLRKTDMGRIMLEADLQMKKDFCKYENPCESEIGEEYWELLDKKSEELAEECMKKHPAEIEDTDNVLFSPVTRHWIVPDKTDVYGTDDEVYIVDMTLNIESDPVYEHSTYQIVNQNPSLSDECKEDLDEAAKEYGRYAMELEEVMILPLVVQEVNHGGYYSDLRQVYTSLALAQWYKDKYWHTSGIFTNLIDSKDLTELESKYIWDAEDIWRDYVKSFEEGEYHCWKNRTYEKGDYIITESLLYSSGGVDFTDITLTNIGDMPSNLKELTSEAIYTFFANEGDDYYFGMQTPHQNNNVTPPVATPTSEEDSSKGVPGFKAVFAIVGLLLVAYLLRRRK